MRYPTQLFPGQTIGLVAPSLGAAIEPYASCLTYAERIFEDMGYKVHEYSCARRNDGYGISSTPEFCGKEMQDAWTDDVSQVLFSCGGGELMCETISYMDFEKIKEAPAKWFMGYSDNTNLVHLLVTLTNTAAIYGPCAPAFGMQDWHASISDAFDIITKDVHEDGYQVVHSYDGWQSESLKDEEHPYEPYNIDSKLQMHGYVYDNGFKESDVIEFGGTLIGGCVDCLANLVGTKFDKTADFVRDATDGVVWMLECCELSPMDLRRALWQMNMAGWFKNAKGFIFGRPDRYGEESLGKTFDDVVIEFFDQFDIHTPCILDADFGHKPPMMPIVMGSVGDCHFQDGAMSLTMNFK